MTSYKSLKDAKAEIIISRSKFIAKVYHIKDEEAALEILKSLRKKYADATHICYGYVADTAGFTARFSDDGEPSGTAGQPIIDAVLRRGLRQVLVAVIRYFGGIKLGAGGLTRAYSECATTVMDKASEINFVLCDIYKVRADFSDSEKIKKHAEEYGKILNVEYYDSVMLKIAMPRDSNFERVCADHSGGKAVIEKIGSDFIQY